MGCYNKRVIPATADQVWDTIRNFHNMDWAAGVIEKVTVVGEAGPTEPGARRVLNDAFYETLRSVDDANREFTYSIDDGPGPVSKDSVKGYVGRVKVSPEGDAALVEWSSEWQEGSDEVQPFCDPIYQAALAALENHFS